MPTDPESFGRPIESQLNVEQMFTVVNYNGSNPPTMNLTLDVEHADTGHTWRVGVQLRREQIIELATLLVNACEKNDLPYRADLDET